MSVICGAKWLGISIERVGCHIVCSLSWCSAGKLRVVTLFSVMSRSDWGSRVAKWILEYWSVMLGEPIAIGGVYQE